MRTLSFVLVSTLFAYLLAQDCNNPLLNAFNLTGLDTPQSGAGLAFCGNLQNGQTCCSAETVQSFQSRLDNLTTSLQDLAGQRDVYMTELYANYSSEFQRAADDLTDYSDEISRLQRDNSTVGNETRYQYNGLNRIARALDNIDNNFRSAIQDYQQRRAACFNTVLQVQSSAWCLACDPNYASVGVLSNGSVNSSPAVCNAIQQSCLPYVEQSSYLNPLFQAQQAYQRLVNLTGYLRDYERNNFTLPENVTLENDLYVPANDTERTSALPPNCTNGTCQWQCSNFFSPSFVLNSSIVANGGGILGGDDLNFTAIGANISQANNSIVVNDTANVVNETVGDAVTTVTGGRLLQELQESLWTPDLSGTGLIFNVVNDPADIAAILNNNPIFDDSDNNQTDNDENTLTDNDDDFTDNDGINTTNEGFDNTDFDGVDTTGNDLTDNDGIDTTDNDGVNTGNDLTDNDGVDTTGAGGVDNTDNDGVNTVNDPTDNDGVNTGNDLTDNDGVNTNQTNNNDDLTDDDDN